MATTLKDETILNQWTMLIDGAAGQEAGVLRDIQEGLRAAQIPGGCTWEVDEVKAGGWLDKVKRDFLIVKIDQFRDYRTYVGVRDYGSHLHLCRFLTVEPGAFKKMIASSLSSSNDPYALSAPKNILVEQDLSAWATVVHHAVLDATSALMTKQGQDPSKIRRESRGILEVW